MSRVKTEDRGAVRIDVGIPGRAGGTVQAFQAGDHFHPAIGQSNIQEHRVCAAGDARFWVRDKSFFRGQGAPGRIEPTNGSRFAVFWKLVSCGTEERGGERSRSERRRGSGMMTMVPPHLGQRQRELGCWAASSPRISRSANGERFCMTRTWQPPSWIASSSADALSASMGPRGAPVIRT